MGIDQLLLSGDTTKAVDSVKAAAIKASYKMIAPAKVEAPKAVESAKVEKTIVVGPVKAKTTIAKTKKHASKHAKKAAKYYFEIAFKLLN